MPNQDTDDVDDYSPVQVTPREFYQSQQKKLRQKTFAIRKVVLFSEKASTWNRFFPGSGGRIREGMSLSGFVVKQIALSKFDDSNPREAILRHAKVYRIIFSKTYENISKFVRSLLSLYLIFINPELKGRRNSNTKKLFVYRAVSRSFFST